MKKTVPFLERIKSIKFVAFMLIFIASCVFLPLGKIDGTQFVTLMGLIMTIFTAGHEVSKRTANDYNKIIHDGGEDNGGNGNEKPPIN